MFEAAGNSKAERATQMQVDRAEGLNAAEIMKDLGSQLGDAGKKLGEIGGGGGKWGEGHGPFFTDKKKPENACVEDKDGYIVCGPIVGYERPEEPRIIKPLQNLQK